LIFTVEILCVFSERKTGFLSVMKVKSVPKRVKADSVGWEELSGWQINLA
jgi:hypothetical protein